MPTTSQLIQQGYGGYAGWQDTEANADFNATKGSGKFTGASGRGQSSSSSGGGDMQSYFDQQNRLQQQAIAPAIQSLQASIPTIQKNTATQIGQKQAEIQPLQDRYKALLDQIKGVGQTSVNKQTVVTANELGKRGIEGSSTLAGQEIASATLPIEQQTQSLVKDTGFAQEADLRGLNNDITNLGNTGTEKEQAIAQAIAQLQAGGGQSAITNAMTLLSNAQAADTAKTTATETARQNDIKNAIAQLSATNETKLTDAQIRNINSQIADRGTTPNSSNVSSYYTKPGVTNVTGTPGNYKSSAGGQVLPGGWQ